MEELIKWLEDNKIAYNKIDHEVVELPGMGKVFYEDLDKMDSLFKTDEYGELVFNNSEDYSVLENEEIYYICFKFGDNWYYTDIRRDFRLNILKYVGEKAPGTRHEEFVNLGVHTAFELLNGSFLIEDWVRKARFLGHTALGVCDRNTMASLYSLQTACKANGMKCVFGYTLEFTDGDDRVGGKVYVQSQQGLKNLLRIQKAVMVDSDSATIGMEELLSLAGGNVFVFDKYSPQWMLGNIESVKRFTDAFDTVYYQVDLSEYKAERIDIKVLESTKTYFDSEILQALVQPVLISDCYYLDKSDYKNKIILNKIDTGAAHEQSDDQYFKDIDEHWAVFSQIFDPEKRDVEELFARCCEATVRIAEGAEAAFEDSRNFMPKYDMTEEEKERYGTTHNMFAQLLEEGLKRLAPPDKVDIYRKQMEYEKYIIESTDNVDYLLVQYDTVNWCRRNSIRFGCGRGSAAGSLLLYLLGITLVDPIKYGLIFERFLLPERAGLYSSDATIIGEQVSSRKFVEIELEGGKKLKFDKDAQFLVRRGDGEPIKVYADELEEDDDILFDNRDKLFTINEI